MGNRLFIASDHAGFVLKKHFVEKLQSVSNEGRAEKIHWEDLGTFSQDSTDYPDWAHKLCDKIRFETSEQERLEPCGVLICGSGVGVSISANRHPEIRAVLALREDVAHFSRAHNASNVLCLGARFVSPAEAEAIFLRWINSKFEGGRHLARIKKIESPG